MSEHYPAALINAIAEEGTKAEAVEWLQKQWNENCELRAEIERLRADNQKAQFEIARLVNVVGLRNDQIKRLHAALEQARKE